MDDKTPALEDRLQAVLANIQAAAANTRRMVGFEGDEDWVLDGESDAEALREVQRETLAQLDAGARAIEDLLARRRAD